MSYLFRSEDHPESHGRTPKAGEESFSFWFTAEQGKIEIRMGRKGIVNHAATLIAMLRDDQALREECLQAVAGVDAGDFLEMDTRKRKK